MKVVISGCSGGGKSTLLAAFARRGYSTFDEPGRQVVKAQLACGGDGLPWSDVGQFIALCVAVGVRQWDEAAARGAVRVSLGTTTTDADLERLLEVLPRIAARLRGSRAARC